MAETRFTGSFTQQEPIPEDGIAAAVDLLRSGRLHRYNTVAGETPAAAALEAAYAAWQGQRYCLALASGGYALATALRALGVGHGDKVLTNAFTLAPVPGAITSVGAEPVLVEVTEDLLIDPDDLAAKARASGARVLLLSLMRGHLGNMDKVMQVVAAEGLTLVEDCAHTMGARFDGTRSGNFGVAGCFSTQTYKHMNSGEGGLLVSEDAAFMARAIILSGSYMNYERHGAAPPPEAFRQIRLETPNCSGRMDNLRAAILLPQLTRLEEQCAAWTERYRIVESALRDLPGVTMPHRGGREDFVGSSLQFRLAGAEGDAARAFLADCAALGVELKWFGAPEPQGFTSLHHSWAYIPAQALPRTDAILATLFDMRLPLTFSPADCRHLGAILNGAIGRHMARVGTG
ncbi:DegT/DnrJ/EryC1/StrS family aminotransferase [Oceanibium sediminis]|uniref:DegT/DnrJ/EryC1/StrS family aminotransferase n=1 Tax=Oceanibium sediminis TaxID=2026339 RepID=UPI000DD3AD5B|nr:DegT/DnrJ/EryC1/StrS family aminotransferase [Oceanibium sediminis]